jgi:high potential iron-sulfur protein
MTDTPRVQSNGPSRRITLLRGVGCAVGAAAALLPIRQAAAKMAQTAVGYQVTPKGDQQCSNCSLFQPPSACTLIDGTISPSGWCKFWVKKAP